MVLIEWSKNLSVDIDIIDEQHKKLLKYMNDLYQALTEHKEKEILMDLFNDLDEYTKTHFTLEEEYFKKFNYKDKDIHIQLHKDFINNLNKMKLQIPKDLMDTEDLLSFLVEWIKGHIKVNDHEYIDCFHKNGLK
ncbi:MAG: bacteriohemerythrin [Candidatus Pacearchaeota archaeon]|jgi:hemerythrin-like metal-binding protein